MTSSFLEQIVMKLKEEVVTMVAFVVSVKFVKKLKV